MEWNGIRTKKGLVRKKDKNKTNNNNYNNFAKQFHRQICLTLESTLLKIYLESWRLTMWRHGGSPWETWRLTQWRMEGPPV
jgi:hypothetical protein